MSEGSGKRVWSRGDLLVVGGGAATVIAAFLTWFDGYGSAFASGLRPVATFPFVCALLIVGRQLVPELTSISLPDRVGRFSWPQIDFFFAGYATITGLSFVVISTNGTSRGIGLWLNVPATIVLLVGVLLQHRERGTAPAAPAAPAAPDR